jgi:hypothetical protein
LSAIIPDNVVVGVDLNNLWDLPHLIRYVCEVISNFQFQNDMPSVDKKLYTQLPMYSWIHLVIQRKIINFYSNGITFWVGLRLIIN